MDIGMEKYRYIVGGCTCMAQKILFGFARAPYWRELNLFCSLIACPIFTTCT
jgi:hypothetical protein